MMRLTETVEFGGCAAKLPQSLLIKLLKASGARAGTHDIFEDTALLSWSSSKTLLFTLDFLPPPCDDPTIFAQIAVANALSDIYASGGEPQSALMILGIDSRVTPSSTFENVVEAASNLSRKAGAPIVGGHTIYSQGAFLGLAVIGSCQDLPFRHCNAEPGDRIFLTKPIGTGVFTTAMKRTRLPFTLEQPEVASMVTLNASASHAAREIGATCATDITGFGLLGHLGNILRASNKAATLTLDAIPVFPSTLQFINDGIITSAHAGNSLASVDLCDLTRLSHLHSKLLTDPQTSGGLLVLCKHSLPEAYEIGVIEDGPPAVSFA